MGRDVIALITCSPLNRSDQSHCL